MVFNPLAMAQMGMLAVPLRPVDFNIRKQPQKPKMHLEKKGMIKYYSLLIFVFFIFSLSCEKSNTGSEMENSGGFRIEINNSVIYDANDIDFYDFSSQLIYLKTGSHFFYSSYGSFSVLVDKEEIYTGQIYPMYSSYLPSGPVIQCAPTFYNDYVIPIGFIQFIDTTGNSLEDPRSDVRIMEALEKNHQYKKGLSCEILSIQKLRQNRIRVNLQLSTLDSDDLLILDPDRMGPELFHYFTNGLILQDSLNHTYTHHLEIGEPEPWNSWDIDWLTLLRGNETRTISLSYDDFEIPETGDYTAFFQFPGLSYQVERAELYQNGDRIWLGQVKSSKMIDIK